MSSNTIDVLVVGAGPVGLVLANELARFGLSYRIVEKIATRSTWSKALMITSRTMNILEDIGLHEEILSNGTVTEGLDFHFNHRPIASFTMNSNTDPTIRYPFPFVLPQPDVEEAFEHVLNRRGGKIEWEREAVKVDPLKDNVEVTVKTGEVIRARYVVGCDGAHSFVRHSQPDWKFEGRPVNVLWAQCDGTITDERVHTARGAGFVGTTGFSIRLPLYHNLRRFRVIVDVPPKSVGLDPGSAFTYGRVEGQTPTLEQFNQLVKATVGDENFEEITDPIWLTYFMVQERMVSNLRMASRLFLAGDAAHCHSPAGGQGMNMGIQDAHNLAWKLAAVIKGQAVDSDKLLDSYTEERIPIIRKTIALTANMVRGMTAAKSWYSFLISMTISTLAGFKSIQRALIPTLLQSNLTLSPTANGILSSTTTKMVKPGTMLPEPPHPIFSLTDTPPSLTGTTHFLPLIQDSYKHVALFFVGDNVLHEPHPLFQKFVSICEPYKANLRPVILARSCRIGGMRKPNWSQNNDILFLATNTGQTDKAYGLDGKNDMGIIIVRPDGYIAYSHPVDLSGTVLENMDSWLAKTLVKS